MPVVPIYLNIDEKTYLGVKNRSVRAVRFS